MRKFYLTLMIFCFAYQLKASPIWSAARKLDILAFTKALDAEPTVKRKGNGQTILMFCSKLGFNEGVLLLLRRAEDPNQQNYKGRTALHFAIANKQISTAQILMNYGASSMIMDDQGHSPLMLAQSLLFGRQILKSVALNFFTQKLTERWHEMQFKFPVDDPEPESKLRILKHRCATCYNGVSTQPVAELLHLCDGCLKEYKDYVASKYKEQVIFLPYIREFLPVSILEKLNFSPYEILVFQHNQVKLRLMDRAGWRKCPSQYCANGTDIEACGTWFLCDICFYEGCICGASHADGSCEIARSEQGG